jgi:DNA-binding transcriptional LysR family regulator
VVEFLSIKHPGLRIELRDMDTQQVIDALIQGSVDLGIASTLQALNGIAVAPLFQDEFGLVCAAGHPLVGRPGGVTIDAVMAAPFLRNALCDQIETPRLRDRLEEVHLLIHNTHSLLAMVRGGKWVTVLPRSVMEFAPDDLVFQPIVDLPDMRQVYLYLKQQTQVETVARDVHEFITAQDWLTGKKSGATASGIG